MIPWSRAGSWRAETLVSMSLHVSTNIHIFFLDSCALGFGDIPPEGCKKLVLYHRGGRGPEGDPRAPPEVIYVIPQGGAAKEIQE